MVEICCACLDGSALASCRLPEFAWRDAGCAMEAADEVRQVAEAALVGDVADRPAIVGQHARRAPQPRAHQILMRCHTEDAREEAQEVKWAQACLPRGLLQIDRRLRIAIDPQ